MDPWHYLLLMGSCVLITLPLEFVIGARVYRSPRRLAIALTAMLLFIIWDIAAVFRGHWTFSDRFTTGWMIGPMPLEELLFFLVVPICGLLTYEAVGRVLALLRGSGPLRWSLRTGLTREEARQHA